MTQKQCKLVTAGSAVSIITLLLAGVGGYAHLQAEPAAATTDAEAYASYAGTMQCLVDYGNGIRRYYRLTTRTADGNGRSAFTGDRDGGIDVWSWPAYPILGESAARAAQAFVDGYNRRMRNAVTVPVPRP